LEYEKHLKSATRDKLNKIQWNILESNIPMDETIEHIFPQNPSDDCWDNIVKGYNVKQSNLLLNSLGNLLLLGRRKNSALQNDCYNRKRSGGHGKNYGYYNGSHSEIEVAKEYDKWGAEEILERGLDLLRFMEEHWNIKLGNKEEKTKLLGLEFMIK
jgi:hypothetical protein